MAGPVRVVALRLPIEVFADAEAMARAMILRAQRFRPVGERDVPVLYVFPGLYGLSLAGPWPLSLPWMHTLRTGDHLLDAFAEAGAKAARVLRGYVIPGSLFVPDGERLREWTGVFDPEGALIGEQEATQPDPTVDRALGTRLEPIDTDFGPIGILLGRDSEVPETSRILRLMGARLLVAPRAPCPPYETLDAMAGLWQIVQQSRSYGVESGLYGDAGGVPRAGRAAVVAPCEWTPDGSGFVGLPGYYVGDGGMTARIDLGAVPGSEREAAPVPLRPALYRRHAEAFGHLREGGVRPRGAGRV